MRKSKIDSLGAVLLISIMLTLGLNQVAVKLVNEGISPLMQAGLRSAFAAPLLAAYIFIRGKPFNLSLVILIPGIISGTCFALEFALLFSAFEYTTVGRASIFFYTMPFWVAVGAHFLIADEKMTRLKLLGLALACIGVAIALSSNADEALPNAYIGDLMSLCAAILWAAIALIARTTKFSTITPELQILYQIVVSAIILVPFALYLGETLREPTAFHWAILAVQVVFVVCVCFVTWFWVLSIYPASDMASFGFLTPLFGVILGWLILDETITWTIVVALILVAVGIVLVNRKPKAQSAQTAAT